MAPLALMGAWYSAQTAHESVGSPNRDSQGNISDQDAEAARQKLVRQPLNSPALRSLALAIGAESTAGVRLLRLSDRVSRQDLETQLYLLELNAQAGDIPASLRHYDTVLSAYPQAGRVLLDILVRGLGDPELRDALLPYADRGWFGALLRRAAGRDADPRHALSLVREAGLLSQPDRRDAIASLLLTALIAGGAVDEAAAFADQLDVDGWRHMGFHASTFDPRLGELAWKLESSGMATAQWKAPDRLDVSVGPLHSAVLARRVTLFSPGDYQLSFALESQDHPHGELEWRMSCRDTGAAEVIGAVRTAGLPPRRLELAVTIPADCPRQVWNLRAHGADAAGDSRATISELELDLR